MRHRIQEMRTRMHTSQFTAAVAAATATTNSVVYDSGAAEDEMKKKNRAGKVGSLLYQPKYDIALKYTTYTLM